MSSKQCPGSWNQQAQNGFVASFIGNLIVPQIWVLKPLPYDVWLLEVSQEKKIKVSVVMGGQ